MRVDDARAGLGWGMPVSCVGANEVAVVAEARRVVTEVAVVAVMAELVVDLVMSVSVSMHPMTMAVTMTMALGGGGGDGEGCDGCDSGEGELEHGDLLIG